MNDFSVVLLMWVVLGFVSGILELYIKKDIMEYVSIPYFLLWLFGPIGIITLIVINIPSEVKNPFYKGK